MKISVIIPNYNGKELLKKNLPQIFSKIRAQEYIVVDDASSDGSTEFVRKNFPKIKIIEMRNNKGFSSSVNRGVMEADGDLVVLVNTDIYPKNDILKYAVNYFTDPLVFAVGFNQECNEKAGVIYRGRGTGKFHHGFLHHQRAPADGNSTLWVSGGAGIFRREIWIKIGGLYEIYNPFYWEDIDLSYRAIKTGYKIFFEPKSICVHEQSIGSIRTVYDSKEIRKIALRNQIFFVWLNINDIKYLFDHIINLLKLTLRSLFLFDFPSLIAILKACSKFPFAFNLRLKNSKLWRIKDEEII